MLLRSACVLLLVLLAGHGQALAQTRSFELLVLDQGSRLPLPDVAVRGPSDSLLGHTNDPGRIVLRRLSHPLRLRLACPGFETRPVDASVLENAAGPLVLLLQPIAPSLKEVRIDGRAAGVFRNISQLDIQLRPISNSQEVLRIVPGLFIGQHAGGGKSEQIFLRGFDIDHGTDIRINVDGMPVNMVSHAHGQGYADLHFLIPELIARVDFNKGPYFADKGNFTTAGYVDFETRAVLENNFLKLEGGSFHTLRAVAGVNLIRSRNGAGQDLYLAGEGFLSRGYFDSPQGFRRFNGQLKYRLALASHTVLTASVSAFGSRWNASGQIPERAVASGAIGFYGAIDDTEGGNTARYNLSLRSDTRMRNGAVIRNQVFATKYDFTLYSNFTFFREDPINGDQIRQQERRTLLGYNGSYSQSWFIGDLPTTTRAGIQFRTDDVPDIELSRTKDRMLTTEAIRRGAIRETNLGAWVEQKTTVLRRLDLTLGLRADRFVNRYDDALLGQRLQTRSAILSPKLQLEYRLGPRARFYLYNGRGFHSNDTRVAVRERGRKILPPAYGTDLGVVLKPVERLLIQSALWHLWLDQEFVYVGDEGIVEPGGRTRRMGIDLSVRYELVPKLFLDVDASLADPRALDVPKAERFLPLAPRFTSTGGLTYRNEYGWSGSWRYRFMGNRPATEDRSLVAKGYVISEHALTFSARRFSAGNTIQNLFNSKWKETQFATESRLAQEPVAIEEIHFTPGVPFFAVAKLVYLF